MDAKLRECPFCGGEAKWGCFPLDYPNTQVRAYVYCDNCDAQIKTDGRVKESKQLLDQSITKWNRRADDLDIRSLDDEEIYPPPHHDPDRR